MKQQEKRAEPAVRQKIKNIFQLGLKELRGLVRDPLMLALILYTFTLGVYVAATAAPDSISNAALAVVDEDDSQLSRRITDAFFPPMFLPAARIDRSEIDPEMDNGKYTFVLVIPYDFQKDVLAGNRPEIQLNIDATRMSQAFTGGGYIQEIIMNEVGSFVNRNDPSVPQPVEIVTRNRFNPNLTQAWFGSVMELINNITMLAIILTGAALIREREHGTLEHLLVMPVTAFEIMASKVWSMALVVMAAAGCSLIFVIHGMLQVPVEGSVPLFMLGVALHLFAVTSLGIFLATVAQNHAPARHAADPGADAHADAFRGMTPRESCRKESAGHGAGADHALRGVQPGDPLPRGRFRCGVETVPAAGRDRLGAVRDLLDPLPPDGCVKNAAVFI